MIVRNMNIESLRNYCLGKEDVTEEFPFGEDTLVYKVKGKIFAITSLNDSPLSVNLKMRPDLVPDWRERYSEVMPGYHMNKKHWNTVSLTGRLKPSQIREMIDHSYDLVAASLSKKEKEIIAGL